MYAILRHGGHQYRVSAGDRLVIDRLDAAVGSVVALEPVLLTGGQDGAARSHGLEGVRVAATVVAHRRGPKLRVFTYKAKKRRRRALGFRADLTELRVHSIVEAGADLPGAAGVERSGDDGTAADSGAARRSARRAAAADPSQSAAAPPSRRRSKPAAAASKGDTDDGDGA